MYSSKISMENKRKISNPTKIKQSTWQDINKFFNINPREISLVLKKMNEIKFSKGYFFKWNEYKKRLKKKSFN